MQTPKSQTARRHLLQGLLQVAVALHHSSTGNAHGYQVLMSKGLAHLEQNGVAEEAVKLGCQLDIGDSSHSWAAFIKTVKQCNTKNT